MPVRHATISAILLAGLIAGCAGGYLPSVPDGHPANAQAPQAPAYAESGVLAIEESLPDTVPPEIKSRGGMEHMRHDTDGADGRPGTERTETRAAYSCPMHPDVSADAPGQCPKCGMTLQERKEGD